MSNDFTDLDILKIKRERLRQLRATALDREQKHSLTEEIRKIEAQIAALESKLRGGPGPDDR